MNQTFVTILLALLLVYAIASVIIELRWNTKQKPISYIGKERRRTRKIVELEPLGEQILKETEEMIERDKLTTRDGLKFIIKMMQELYVADMRRTLKVNELVEQFNVLESKSVIAWIEKQPRLSLFISLAMLALLLPETREPLLHYIFQQIGVGP